MALVAGRPFLELLLTQLDRHQFRRVILAVGFNADIVRSHFGAAFKNLEIVYSEEPMPLGTGGALRNAAHLVTSESVLVTNGDSYTNAKLGAFVNEFYRRAADALLLVVPDDGRIDCGNVLVNDSGAVTEFSEKACVTAARRVNAGIYMLSRQLLYDIPEGLPMSLEQELLPRWVREGRCIRATVQRVQCTDIGTPDRYRLAQNTLRNTEMCIQPGANEV
jgi:NDP-sugar pyrophosphorylase family protein